MQQWYKLDIIHRFYVYHCINTALQLENMPFKSIRIDSKERKVKDYKELMPVITLIWMVDDVLNSTEDFTSYIMTPEIISEFLKDDLLWHNENIKQILIKRQEALKQLNNDAKDLKFLQKNKLIFAYQKNIVRNKKYRKYYPWFELAEKTLNKLNNKAEFMEYNRDKILVEVMRKISKDFSTSWK